MATKLSNVIGAPFKDSVLRQFSIRARRNSTVNRSNEEVLFLANKTAWAKLTSSVNIVVPAVQNLLPGVGNVEGFGGALFYQTLGLNPIDYPNPDSLAQKWLLQAGTSKQNGNGIVLRQGIGPDGAYGLGGTEELGYRPMPGLVSVQVETTGRLGSLKQATINFKVWNMNQLNIIEALYFRLGYSMLVEWGHTQYFSNTNSNGTVIPDGVFVNSEIYGIENPFRSETTKEAIQQAIARKAIKTSGNYDGMLGIVSNFTWSFNQEGGYDCVVRLIGLGAVMDSMRINTLYTLPSELLTKYKQSVDIIEEARRLEIAGQQPATAPPPEVGFNFPPTPSNIGELYNTFKTFNRYDNGVLQFQIEKKVYGIVDFGTNELGDDNFYIEFKTGTDNTPLPNTTIEDANSRYGGLWVTNGSTFTRIDRALPTKVYLNPDLINSFVRAYLEEDTAERDKILRATEKISDQPFVLVFESKTRTLNSASGDPVQAKELTLDDILTGGTQGNPKPNEDSIAIRYTVDFPSPADFSETVYLDIDVSTDGEQNYPVTRRVVLEELSKWFQSGAEATIIGISEPDDNRLVEITGEFQRQVQIPNIDRSQGLPSQTKLITFRFKTNNPEFIISSLGPVQQGVVTRQATEEANTGDANGVLNEADDPQTTSSEGLQSALTAMLAIIQTTSQEAALNSSKALIEIDITEQTRKFYESGVFSKVLDSRPSEIQIQPFNLTQYALRGFNSDLMVQPELASEIDPVNFKELCKAYIVRYPKILPDGTSNSVNLPVYIKLGYLLAFLNNMCLFYDSKTPRVGTEQVTGTGTRPYVYIDFNPETNFCLTAPQQLSIDPSICLIPFEGTVNDYKELFPPGIKTTGFFNPEKNNVLTSELTKTGYTFNTDNAYQGKIMNVLLTTEYLLRIIREFAASDNEQSVNLQSFIEKILVDVNKSLGNINSFNLVYRDDANTLQIVDAQYVPKLFKEKTILQRSRYLASLKEDPILAGQLPVFEAPSLNLGEPNGTFSLARDFQFKTTVSTKLASMIAISAQASTGSVNAKDHSSFSYLNQNFEDRYKPYIQDPPSGNKGSNSNSGGQSSNNKEDYGDQKVANLFDAHIKGVYSSLVVTPDKIEMAKNYYIERMSKVKALDVRTVSAPFIPADLEITVDGISGIVMGNAFTIPESRLPISLRSNDGKTKVGFIVTGLSNTIENNEWLTRIRGQMIKLREDSLLKKSVGITGPQQATAPSTTDRQQEVIANTPWSAAFINYVMRTAGVAFPADSFHTGYAQKLYKNKGTYNFQILNPAKTALKPGDIIVKNRNGNNLTFGTDPWTGDSHGDIVVSVTASPNNALAVGGNVGDKVKQVEISLKNDIIQDRGYFVVLRPPSNLAGKIVEVANNELKNWPQNLNERSPLVTGILRRYYQTIGVTV